MNKSNCLEYLNNPEELLERIKREPGYALSYISDCYSIKKELPDGIIDMLFKNAERPEKILLRLIQNHVKNDIPLPDKIIRRSLKFNSISFRHLLNEYYKKLDINFLEYRDYIELAYRSDETNMRHILQYARKTGRKLSEELYPLFFSDVVNFESLLDYLTKYNRIMKFELILESLDGIDIENEMYPNPYMIALIDYIRNVGYQFNDEECEILIKLKLYDLYFVYVQENNVKVNSELMVFLIENNNYYIYDVLIFLEKLHPFKYPNQDFLYVYFEKYPDSFSITMLMLLFKSFKVKLEDNLTQIILDYGNCYIKSYLNQAYVDEDRDHVIISDDVLINNLGSNNTFYRIFVAFVSRVEKISFSDNFILKYLNCKEMPNRFIIYLFKDKKVDVNNKLIEKIYTNHLDTFREILFIFSGYEYETRYLLYYIQEEETSIIYLIRKFDTVVLNRYFATYLNYHDINETLLLEILNEYNKYHHLDNDSEILNHLRYEKEGFNEIIEDFMNNLEVEQ